VSDSLRRTIRRYYGFQFFFALLLWLPVFYEVQKRIGLTDPQIFGIQSLYYLVFCLLEIPTGVAADRLGYRRCMRAGACTLVVANAIPLAFLSYPGFLAHFLAIALARSFLSGAAAAYLYGLLQRAGDPSLYKEVEGRARAYGLVGKVVGWSFMGAALEWHLTLPYWLTVAASLTAVGFAWALPADPVEDVLTGPEATFWGRMRRTGGLLRENPALGLAILQGVALFVLARICQVNLFQPILDSKDFPVATYGLLMAMMTAFEAVGSGGSGVGSPTSPPSSPSRRSSAWCWSSSPSAARRRRRGCSPSSPSAPA